VRKGLILALIILLASFASASQLLAEELHLKDGSVITGIVIAETGESIVVQTAFGEKKVIPVERIAAVNYKERKNDSFISPEVIAAEISVAEKLLKGLAGKAESKRISEGIWNMTEGIFPLAGGIYIIDWAERNEKKDVKKMGYFTAGLGAFEILSGMGSLMLKSAQQRKYEHVLTIDNSTPYGKKARENAAALALKNLAARALIGRLVTGTFLTGVSIYWLASQPFKEDPYAQYNYYVAGMWGLFGLISFFSKSDEEAVYKHYLSLKKRKSTIKVYGGILPGEGCFIKIRYSF